MEHRSKSFISYSRADSDFALKLARDLRESGLNIWIDQFDIIPGENWDRAIQDALKDCDTLLLILSPAATESDNVMDEVSFALEEKKQVIPVLYKPCEVPFRLRRIQRSDFTRSYNTGLTQLRRAFTGGHTSNIEVSKHKILDNTQLFVPFKEMSGVVPGKSRLSDVTKIFGKPDMVAVEEERIVGGVKLGGNKIIHYYSYGLAFGLRQKETDQGEPNPTVDFAYAEYPYKGKSPNGLYIGMPREEALAICNRDYHLTYDYEDSMDFVETPREKSPTFQVWFEGEELIRVKVFPLGGN